MNSTATMSTATTMKVKKSSCTLGHIFHYLENTILLIETKRGQLYLGTLLSSTSSDMNMILTNVLLLSAQQQQRHSLWNHGNHKLVRYYHQTISSSSSSSQQGPTPAAAISTVTTTASTVPTTESNSQIITEQPRPQPPSHNRQNERTTPVVLPTVQIRGSTIRYVHFIDVDHTTINQKVQFGIQRERQAQQQYQRGIRKTSNKK
jgi:small nuclear ribonucleoprotein (snRNP)-like protein